MNNIDPKSKKQSNIYPSLIWIESTNFVNSTTQALKNLDETSKANKEFERDFTIDFSHCQKNLEILKYYLLSTLDIWKHFKKNRL
uniref:Uncharacterized protein n=1 Tax=Romanomermis culicivorax TaxID=13658 RepID=A0A915ID75_ROMCU